MEKQDQIDKVSYLTECLQLEVIADIQEGKINEYFDEDCLIEYMISKLIKRRMISNLNFNPLPSIRILP